MNLHQVKRLAARFGATVEQRPQGYGTRIEALAPDGYLWADFGSVSLVCDIDPGDNRSERLADLAERMSYGLETER